MKRQFALFTIALCCFSLAGCKKNSNNSNDHLTTVTLSTSNYQRYLRMKELYLTSAYTTAKQIEFSGSLTFAIYDVSIEYKATYAGTSNQEKYTLVLDAGGYGKTIAFSGDITINFVTGTCKYRL